jgi:predicted transglutaminase-like protease
MDPLSTITASAIANLAFSEFIKSGAGEFAKKSIGGVIELVANLRNQIRKRFEDNNRAEAALLDVERRGDKASFEKIVRYLDLEMLEDDQFAIAIRRAAQQIINYQNQSTAQMSQEKINIGRDQVNIGHDYIGRDQNIVNQPHGDIRIGGS